MESRDLHSQLNKILLLSTLVLLILKNSPFTRLGELHIKHYEEVINYMIGFSELGKVI